MKQLTIFEGIPTTVREAIEERIKHTDYPYTEESYWQRSYACRERWPEILRRKESGDRRWLESQAKFLRDWLEKKNDPTRHQWIELAMLEWAKEEAE